MTGIDIAGIAKVATSIGFTLGGNAKVAIIVRLTGNKTVDPVTEQTVGDGASDNPVQAFKYKTRAMAARAEELKETIFLVQASDLPAGTVIRETDKVIEGTYEWEIWEILPDPTGATFPLHCRR